MGCGDSASTEIGDIENTDAETEPDTDGDTDTNADADTTIPTGACPSPAPTQIIAVTAAELCDRFLAGDPLTVVDVREPEETAEGLIEGALLYPWTSGVLEADHENLPTGTPLYIICRSGNRSAQASAFCLKTVIRVFTTCWRA